MDIFSILLENTVSKNIVRFLRLYHNNEVAFITRNKIEALTSCKNFAISEGILLVYFLVERVKIQESRWDYLIAVKEDVSILKANLKEVV